MAASTSPRGFVITEAKIPILLALKKIEDLRPHEETVRTDLNGIVRAMQRDPVLRHPIIADSTTGAVLDGTHRLAALKHLGCLTIPTALIDYQNQLVKVDRWYRTIKIDNPQLFLKRLEPLSPVPLSILDAHSSLLERTSYATLRELEHCLAFKSNERAPLQMCRSAFKLEQVAVESHAKVLYTDREETDNLSSAKMLMSTIRLEKQEVVDSCLKHLLFPPKSTRHIIPSRPLGIVTPLRWLRETNELNAEKEFEKHLATMKVRRLPEGSHVGSRRYMEEVFLFE